jgi:hypothetical protein
MALTPILRSNDDDGPAPTGTAQYDQLPAGIRRTLSLREWLWLSDYEKATLEQTETEPDW